MVSGKLVRIYILVIMLEERCSVLGTNNYGYANQFYRIFGAKLQMRVMVLEYLLRSRRHQDVGIGGREIRTTVAARCRRVLSACGKEQENRPYRSHQHASFIY